MTPNKKLRFHASGTALVQDFERLEIGVKAFLGRKYEEVKPGVWGFVPTGMVAEVPYRAEYAKACKDGDLIAADEETAKLCGVPFESNFGDRAEKD
jgi:hypothetical protein